MKKSFFSSTTTNYHPLQGTGAGAKDQAQQEEHSVGRNTVAMVGMKWGDHCSEETVDRDPILKFSWNNYRCPAQRREMGLKLHRVLSCVLVGHELLANSNEDDGISHLLQPIPLPGS